LEDKILRYRIKERLDRVALGNLGDYKFISNGVYELRLAFGSGYRIYYGSEESTVILLLCGGDKSTQKKDIKKAITYLENYLSG
jgi:putative addiction module killer protein